MNSSLRRIVRASYKSPFTEGFRAARQQLEELEAMLEVVSGVPQLAIDDSFKGERRLDARADLAKIQRVLWGKTRQMSKILEDLNHAAMLWVGHVDSFVGSAKKVNLDLMVTLLEGTEAEEGAREVVRLIGQFRDKH